MPKRVEKLVGQLEEITNKIEDVLEDYGCYDDEITPSLGEAIDSLIQLNDELAAQMEEDES